MFERKQVHNLSIGWVVEIKIDKCHITPGFDYTRKIIFDDIDHMGKDVIYNGYQYPILDFNNNVSFNDIKNGSLMILPYTQINNYLFSLGFSFEKGLSFIQKQQIKRIMFGSYLSLLPNGFTLDRTHLDKNQLEVEKQKIKNYRLISLADKPVIKEMMK